MLSELFEIYEYSILKSYLSAPNNPVFKPTYLSRMFDFSLYLEYCLAKNLRLFFKISWTCWIIAVILIMFWNIYLVNSSITFNVIQFNILDLFHIISPLFWDFNLLFTISLYF